MRVRSLVAAGSFTIAATIQSVFAIPAPASIPGGGGGGGHAFENYAHHCTGVIAEADVSHAAAVIAVTHPNDSLVGYPEYRKIRIDTNVDYKRCHNLKRAPGPKHVWYKITSLMGYWTPSKGHVIPDCRYFRRLIFVWLFDDGVDRPEYRQKADCRPGHRGGEVFQNFPFGHGGVLYRHDGPPLYRVHIYEKVWDWPEVALPLPHIGFLIPGDEQVNP